MVFLAINTIEHLHYKLNEQHMIIIEYFSEMEDTQNSQNKLMGSSETISGYSVQALLVAKPRGQDKPFKKIH